MNPLVTPELLVQEARDAIAEVGVSVTILVPSSDVDPIASKVDGAPTPHTVEVSRPADVPRELVDGTTIRAGTLECMLSAEGEIVGGNYVPLTFTPAPGLTLVWEGATYEILEVEPGGAAEFPITYLLRIHE